MRKYNPTINPVKEEKWINDIQKQGYRLKKVTLDFIYHFEKTDEDYVTRLDYRDYMKKVKFEEYKSIHEEFGWEHVRGGRFGASLQTWTKARDGNDEIFSDDESLIKFYKRYSSFTGAFAILFLMYTIIFLSTEREGLIFLTPGLWNMEGAEFWSAFLFELPFALLRMLPALLLPVMFISAIVFFIGYINANKAKDDIQN